MSIAKIIFGVCLLILLGLSGIHWTGGARKAEQKLYDSAERALVMQELNWARTSIDGQKVNLSGFAPSQEIFDQTIKTLNRSSGLGGPIFGGVTAIDTSRTEVYQGFAANEEVETEDTRITPEVFSWRAAHNGERVILSGHVPSDEAKDLIAKAVKQQFRNAKINDTTEPAKGVDEGGWLVAASASLTALAALDSGHIKATGNEFVVNGTAPDEFTAETARQMIANLPAPFTAEENITFIKPAIPESKTVQTGGGAVADGDTVLDAEQCQIEIDRVMSGKQIIFASNQSVIELESRETLDELAAVVLNCTGVIIEIEGHTDSTGYLDDNQRLSTQRANAVKAYLARNGVIEEILTTEGFGPTQPIASNRTAAGRARNRRIEFVVTEREEN